MKSSAAQNVLGQYNRSSFEMKVKEQLQSSSPGQKVYSKVNPEYFKGADDCTPWETDVVNFD